MHSRFLIFSGTMPAGGALRRAFPCRVMTVASPFAVKYRNKIGVSKKGTMKILLIQPPDDTDKPVGGGWDTAPVQEPLGLLYIAAVCRDAGYDVAVIDAFAEKLTAGQLEERIFAVNPAVIGFTSMITSGGFLYHFGSALKKKMPGTFFVFGNLHASIYAEQYLRHGCCDVVVHGEGEYVFLELLSVVEGKRKLEDISSLSFLRDGVFVTTAPAEPPDLSRLPPPARDLVNQKLYDIRLRTRRGKVSKHMFTSRGCVNRCTFCVLHGHGQPRFNTVQRAVDELELLVREYNAGFVYIMDSLFTVNRERVLAICEEIRKRKLDVHWGCESHVRCIDAELIKSMESAGCCYMVFGIETGVQRLLDTVKKGVCLEMIESSLAMVKANSRISIMGLFIFGFPGETPEDSSRTIDFACRLPLDMAMFSILVPYPGTPIFNELRDKGQIDTGIRSDGTLDPSVWLRYWPRLAFRERMPIWITPEQTGAGLKKTIIKAFTRFYLRPRPFWFQLQRLSLSNVRVMLKGYIAAVVYALKRTE
jgi:radical SAM superfamily enzyme YgiQ (UPF0313 family)